VEIEAGNNHIFLVPKKKRKPSHISCRKPASIWNKYEKYVCHLKHMASELTTYINYPHYISSVPTGSTEK